MGEAMYHEPLFDAHSHDNHRRKPTIDKTTTRSPSPAGTHPADLTNQRFGHLTVLEPTHYRRRRYVLWRCGCDCGRETCYSAIQLKRGSARNYRDTSCEYYQQERVEDYDNRYEDLTGLRVGKLVVVRMATADDISTDTALLSTVDDISTDGALLPAVDGRLTVDNLPTVDSQPTVNGRPTVDDNTGATDEMTVDSHTVSTDHTVSTNHTISTDHTGVQRGKQVVTGRYGHVLWLCKCDCGNTVLASTSHLKSGLVRSCGCLVYGVTDSSGMPTPRRDLTGQRFGKLTVIAYEGKREKRVKRGGRSGRGFKNYWRCRCDCGNEIVVCQDNLRKDGHTTSCGCIRRRSGKRAGKRGDKDINS